MSLRVTAVLLAVVVMVSHALSAYANEESSERYTIFQLITQPSVSVPDVSGDLRRVVEYKKQVDYVNILWSEKRSRYLEAYAANLAKEQAAAQDRARIAREAAEAAERASTESVPVLPAPSGSIAGGGDVKGEWLAGYRAFGGPTAYEWQLMNVTIPCESGWNPYADDNPPYKGLGQFDDQTWAGAASITGLWDIWNPYHQGANMAVVAADRGLTPWPVCGFK